LRRLKLSRTKRVSIVSGKIVICFVPSELFLREAHVKRPKGKVCSSCAEHVPKEPCMRETRIVDRQKLG
jgi:hypothetical protein